MPFASMGLAMAKPVIASARTPIKSIAKEPTTLLENMGGISEEDELLEVKSSSLPEEEATETYDEPDLEEIVVDGVEIVSVVGEEGDGGD